MKRKIIFISLSIVFIAALGFSGWTWRQIHLVNAERMNLTQNAQFLIDFALNYGMSAKYQGYQIPRNARIVFRDNNGQTYVSIYIDGQFVELGILASDNQTSTP